jgi:DNA-binding LytR/AlgR family response regulator
MNCLIIEDEFPAVERLKGLLHKVAPDLEVLTALGSVADSLAWLRAHPAPDVILSDIQLSDGLSFEIYQQITVRSPIVFTTAYDEYAIKAFKVNSIDYLLKPIKPEALRQALDKWRSLQPEVASMQTQLQAMLRLMQPEPPAAYKRRFLVAGKDQLIPVDEAEIAYFTTAYEAVYLVRTDGRRFAVDYKLDQLSDVIDPRRFFRFNRQYLGQLAAITHIHPYFNGRIKLHLSPDPGEEVLVSREKARGFKAWVEGE